MGGESVSGISAGEAILHASVNPEGSPSTYHFEYATEQSFAEGGFTGGRRAPVSDASAGKLKAQVAVKQPISGLEPNTTYRYRIVAGNDFGTAEGDPRSFTTRPAESPALPDGRAYEMVSPAEKHGANVHYYFGAAQASEDGDAVVFGSLGAFADASSAPLMSFYRAERGTSAWQTRNITPPSSAELGDTVMVSQLVGLTSDLSRELFFAFSAPPALPGSEPSSEYLYRRMLPDGPYENLIPSAPADFKHGAGNPFGEADNAMDMVAFNVPEKLTNDAPAAGKRLICGALPMKPSTSLALPPMAPR